MGAEQPPQNTSASVAQKKGKKQWQALPTVDDNTVPTIDTELLEGFGTQPGPAATVETVTSSREPVFEKNDSPQPRPDSGTGVDYVCHFDGERWAATIGTYTDLYRHQEDRSQFLQHRVYFADPEGRLVSRSVAGALLSIHTDIFKINVGKFEHIGVPPELDPVSIIAC